MRYGFGHCELDEELRLLRRRGREVPLQPKVFELLHFLLRHRARVVPKEVLLCELWPDAYVTTASLTRLVKEARRATGDNGHRQRVIQTLHRFGYRFIADVRVHNGEAASEDEHTIELARRSLEAAVELGARDLRERVREFAETCLLAIQSARETATGRR
jgi:DNA-binding winged helix-turn-helix (wHTH) protein